MSLPRHLYCLLTVDSRFDFSVSVGYALGRSDGLFPPAPAAVERGGKPGFWLCRPLGGCGNESLPELRERWYIGTG